MSWHQEPQDEHEGHHSNHPINRRQQPTSRIERYCDLQGLQGPYTLPGGNYSCQERKESRTSLTKACNPPNAACKEPMWQNPRSMVHGDRVHGAEEHADERDGQGVSDEGWHEPDDEFKPESSDRF